MDEKGEFSQNVPLGVPKPNFRGIGFFLAIEKIKPTICRNYFELNFMRVGKHCDRILISIINVPNNHSKSILRTIDIDAHLMVPGPSLR